MLEAFWGKGKHVGCFFHWKQAISKYSKDKCGLGNSVSLEAAIKVGDLDILCVLPWCKLFKYAIPFDRSIIEYGIPMWLLEKWAIFWKYFKRQWIPILASWNIRKDDREIIQMMKEIQSLF